MRQDFSLVPEEKFAKLFPILLTEHNPKWKEEYMQETVFLCSVFDDNVIRINHIGSSSVAGLIAKPTVDILLEVSEDTDIATITERLLDEGYVVNHANKDIITYIKGYTPHGFEGQTFHIHVRHSGDWGELYFRDYLNSHSDVAREYEKLKMELREIYTYDRDGYTDAKGEFVIRYTEKARVEYPNKYSF